MLRTQAQLNDIFTARPRMGGSYQRWPRKRYVWISKTFSKSFILFAELDELLIDRGETSSDSSNFFVFLLFPLLYLLHFFAVHIVELYF